MVFCLDRKSTRLNSSHTIISYAVFCLKKKRTSDAGTTDESRLRVGGRRWIRPPRAVGAVRPACLPGLLLVHGALVLFYLIVPPAGRGAPPNPPRPPAPAPP